MLRNLPALNPHPPVTNSSDTLDTPPQSQNLGVLNPSSVVNATPGIKPPRKLFMPEVFAKPSLCRLAYNINTAHIPSAPPAMITLNDGVPKSPLPPTLTEKMAQYSEYRHYGQNPADAQTMMNELEARDDGNTAASRDGGNIAADRDGRNTAA